MTALLVLGAVALFVAVAITLTSPPVRDEHKTLTFARSTCNQSPSPLVGVERGAVSDRRAVKVPMPAARRSPETVPPSP